MERTVPRILYACSESHTEKVFRADDYARLVERFDFHVGPTASEYESAQLANDIAGCEVLITGWGAPPVTKAAMANTDRLRLITHTAGSLREVLGEVVEELIARGVRVFGARRCIAYNVAEMTVGSMIMGSRNWYEQVTHSRTGNQGAETVPRTGLYLRGSTVGLVSASTVGREVIHLLAPFDVKILVYDPYLSEYEAGRLGVEQVADLESLFARSDIVSLHAPVTDETRGMIGARHFARIRHGALLINTARAAILDSEALLDAAQEGRFQVHLDVTEPEPLPAEHPLRTLTNVYLTPHTSGSGTYGYLWIGEACVRAIESFYNGRPIEGEVDLRSWDMLA